MYKVLNWAFWGHEAKKVKRASFYFTYFCDFSDKNVVITIFKKKYNKREVPKCQNINGNLG